MCLGRLGFCISEGGVLWCGLEGRGVAFVFLGGERLEGACMHNWSAISSMGYTLHTNINTTNAHANPQRHYPSSIRIYYKRKPIPNTPSPPLCISTPPLPFPFPPKQNTTPLPSPPSKEMVGRTSEPELGRMERALRRWEMGLGGERVMR